ncbi:MAG TPA: methyltransferase domain-containing protein [Polyangiales bacterium]|nr:methyltransferase domain-containing protein [Polyangiales bacterium]
MPKDDATEQPAHADDTGAIYGALAGWWPLFSSPAHYLEEAHAYRTLLLEACDPPPRTLLELGSGGGGNASHLKLDFALTLVDRAPGMLAVSRALNPECEHLLGDMRDVRLGRTFDAVFVHDAVSYLTSLDDLAQAARTAFVHCRAGGVALFAPDAFRETFRETTNCGGSEDDTRALRYLQWLWDPDPADDTYVADWACLLREGDAVPRVVHERHVFGLFARADWLRVLSEAGFEARCVPFEHSQVEAGTMEVLVARRPR